MQSKNCLSGVEDMQVGILDFSVEAEMMIDDFIIMAKKYFPPKLQEVIENGGKK